jgi:hypothetical protein
VNIAKRSFNAPASGRAIAVLALCAALAAGAAFGQAAAPANAPPAEAAPVAKAAPVTRVEPAGKIEPAGKGPRISQVAYNRSIVLSDFAGLSRPVILRMQAQLAVIYHDLADWHDDASLQRQPLNDGVVGPVTLDWLQRYAFTFKFADGAQAGRELPAHMDRLAKFAAAHPAELAILLGQPFEAWDAAQPPQQRAQDYAVRREGEEAPLLALLRRYRDAQAPSARAAPARAWAQGQNEGDYYMLTKRDLARLGGKVTAGTLLAAMKDKTYRDENALRAAFLAALDGRADPQDQLWKAVASNAHARPSVHYALEKATWDKLRKSREMAPASLEQLEKKPDTYLTSSDQYYDLISGWMSDGSLAISESDIALLEKQARVSDKYRLDQIALDTIDRQMGDTLVYTGLPPALLAVLAKLEDIDYPDAAIFDIAAKSRIASGLGMCRPAAGAGKDGAVGAVANQAPAIAGVDLAALVLQTNSPAVTQAKVDALRNVPKHCSEAQLADARHIVGAVYDPMAATLHAVTRKKSAERSVPVVVQDAGCGCGLDELEGQVIAFYPYSRTPGADGKPQPPLTVNFRPINRIGVIGLHADNEGRLALEGADVVLTNSDRTANGFARAAHQHNAKIVWVIQKSDWGPSWQGLSTEQRQHAFARLVGSISMFLDTPLGSKLQKALSSMTFDDEIARRGDGVTLYFPGYPTDAQSRDEFNTFYGQLREQMAKKGLALNLLVTQDTLTRAGPDGQGAFSLANLIDLRRKRMEVLQSIKGGPLERMRAAQKNPEYLIVLLNESSLDAKRALFELVGHDPSMNYDIRAKFLRSIVPVVQFDQPDWQQLRVDLVFADDNFGGVGLWAPDFSNAQDKLDETKATCAASQQIGICVLEVFIPGRTAAESIAHPVEAFACIHREGLQWLLLVFLACCAVLAAFYFYFCKVKSFVDEHLIYALALAVVFGVVPFLLLLFYAPFMADVKQGNVPFVATAVFAVAIIVWVYFHFRGGRLPRREGGQAQQDVRGFPILASSMESGKDGFRWLIKNGGTGYAIIRKVEVMLDGAPSESVRAALSSQLDLPQPAPWQSTPVLGQKLAEGKHLAGLSLPPGAAADALAEALRSHKLTVQLTYSGPDESYWRSDGAAIVPLPGVA